MTKFKTRIGFCFVATLLATAALAASLKDETLGGFKLKDPPKKVTDKYGPPEQKEGPQLQEATGEWWWTYHYPAQGMDFVFSGATNQEQNLGLSSIRASGRSTAKTPKGIGIGSTKAQVKKAYGATGHIVNEKEWRALYFTYQGDKVSELTLTSNLPE